MYNFSVPDICDEFSDIQIGDLILNSYGSKNKFFGQIHTAKCEHSNSIVKECVNEQGEGKVLLIEHTGSELCSMVGDQIAQKAYENRKKRTANKKGKAKAKYTKRVAKRVRRAR